MQNFQVICIGRMLLRFFCFRAQPNRNFAHFPVDYTKFVLLREWNRNRRSNKWREHFDGVIVYQHKLSMQRRVSCRSRTLFFSLISFFVLKNSNDSLHFFGSNRFLRRCNNRLKGDADMLKESVIISNEMRQRRLQNKASARNTIIRITQLAS